MDNDVGNRMLVGFGAGAAWGLFGGSLLAAPLGLLLVLLLPLLGLAAIVGVVVVVPMILLAGASSSMIAAWRSQRRTLFLVAIAVLSMIVQLFGQIAIMGGIDVQAKMVWVVAMILIHGALGVWVALKLFPAPTAMEHA